MESVKKPVISELYQKDGTLLRDLTVRYDAAEIDGFLPVESPDRDGSTLYIAIDNIASFTVRNEESFCIKGALSRK